MKLRTRSGNQPAAPVRLCSVLPPAHGDSQPGVSSLLPASSESSRGTGDSAANEALRFPDPRRELPQDARGQLLEQIAICSATLQAKHKDLTALPGSPLRCAH